MTQSIWNKKWVVGNWKMNGRLSQNTELLHHLQQIPEASNVFTGIAAPFVYLPQIQQLTQNTKQHFEVFAQDVSRFANNGAYTGEISAQMLQDIGIQATLIGHSERSIYFNESNNDRRAKLENAQAANLQTLLCVGESLEQRENGQEKETVAAQLAVLSDLESQNIAVAYEPLWAIGTGKTANNEQIAQMHEFIYQEILSLCGNNANIRVLYGGSVNDKNAAEIFSVPHVDGALVGGASLKHDSFAAIIKAAQETV